NDRRSFRWPGRLPLCAGRLGEFGDGGFALHAGRHGHPNGGRHRKISRSLALHTGSAGEAAAKQVSPGLHTRLARQERGLALQRTKCPLLKKYSSLTEVK